MSKKTLKVASLLAAGGMMLQFGGCGQGLGKAFLNGFGGTLGSTGALAVEAALLGPMLAELNLGELLGLNTTP